MKYRFLDVCGTREIANCVECSAETIGYFLNMFFLLLFLYLLNYYMKVDTYENVLSSRRIPRTIFCHHGDARKSRLLFFFLLEF